MRKKASKMSRFAAKIVGTYGSAAAMGADLPDPAKCMTPCAHSVERRLKSRSNRVTTVRFCAGTALHPAADRQRNHFLKTFLMYPLSGPSGPDFFWSNRRVDFCNKNIPRFPLSLWLQPLWENSDELRGNRLGQEFKGISSK